MCLDPRTWPGVRVLIQFVTRTTPICLGLRNSGIRAARLLSDGAPSWTLVDRLVLMERSSAWPPPVTVIAVEPDPLRIPILGPVIHGMSQRGRTHGDTPLTSPRIPAGPRRLMWTMIWMMKHIFPKAARSCHLAIGTGVRLHTPLGIAHWMLRLSRARHIMGINGGIIHSRRRLLSVVVIEVPVEVSLSTVTILFFSTARLWMHGTIAAHSRVGLRWTGS